MRKRALVILLIAVVQFITTCGNSSTNPENVNPLLGTWELDKTIFSVMYGMFTLSDTLSSGQNQVSGKIDLKIDNSCIYYLDVQPVFIIDSIEEMPLETTTTIAISDTGTWYLNDTLLVLKGKTLDEYKFNYSLEDGVLITESITTIETYNISMRNYWTKQ